MPSLNDCLKLHKVSAKEAKYLNALKDGYIAEKYSAAEADRMAIEAYTAELQANLESIHQQAGVAMEAPKIEPNKPQVEAPKEIGSKSKIAGQARIVRALKEKATEIAQTDPAKAKPIFAQLAKEQEKLNALIESKRTGPRLPVGMAANGEPDLLSNIADYIGRIQTKPKPGMEAAGDFDGWEVLNSGAARALRGGTEGMAPDEALSHINEIGYKFDSIGAFQVAIDNAIKARRSTLSNVEKQKYTMRVERAALTGEGRNITQKSDKMTIGPEAGQIAPGDTFNILGEKFSVLDVEEEADGSYMYIIQNGHRFKVKEGTEFYPDKGSLKKSDASVDALSGWDDIAETKPPAANEGEVIPTDDMPFNLAGEQQDETKSAVELAQEAEQKAADKKAAEEKQGKMFEDVETPVDRLKRHIATLENTMAADKRRSIKRPEDVARLQKLKEELAAAEKPAAPQLTLNQVADAARERARNDPSLPPAPPDIYLTLDAVSKKRNRRGYDPDMLSAARIEAAFKQGLLEGSRANPRYTEAGDKLLSDGHDMARARDLALGVLSDRLSDEAVTQWRIENDPESADAKEAASKKPAPDARLFEDSMTPEEKAELDAIEKELKRKFDSELPSGIDPEYFALGSRMAAIYVKAGARTFRDFAKAMMAKFGEKARPYLLAWYENLRHTGKGFDSSVLDSETEAQKVYDAEYSNNASEGERTVPQANGGSSPKRSPVARVVRKELIPRPQPFVGADTYASNAGFRLDADQILGSNAVLTHFSKNPNKGAFLLGDGTGFGKTAQILAVIDQYRKQHPGAKVLYVTQNKQMLAGTWTRDSKAMGIDLSGVDAMTYDGLKKNQNRTYDLAIYDEAHNLKNGESQKAMAEARINAKHTMYATATPMDRPTGAAYFLAAITGESEVEVGEKLGYTIQTREDPITRELTEYAVLKPGNTWHTVWEHIMQYRDAAITGGAMLRREYPFYGTVKEVEVEGDYAHTQIGQELEAYYDDLIDNAFSPTARRNYAGQKTLTLRRWSEQSKIQTAFDKAMAHLKSGGSVIIMAETDKKQSFPIRVTDSVPGKNDKGRTVYFTEGAITKLAQMFAAQGIEVAHIHDTTKNNVANEVDKFQSGKARVVLATPASGGAGINLDDVVGNKPRLMMALSPNLAGDVFDQVLGRVSRKTTQSESVVELFHNPNNYGDERSKDIRDKKLRTLRAIQGGQDPDAAGFSETAEPVTKVTDKIINALESAKINKPGDGNLRSSDPFTLAWDGAMDAAILGIRAGRAIADVIKDAIEMFKKNFPGATQKQIDDLTKALSVVQEVQDNFDKAGGKKRSDVVVKDSKSAFGRFDSLYESNPEVQIKATALSDEAFESGDFEKAYRRLREMDKLEDATLRTLAASMIAVRLSESEDPFTVGRASRFFELAKGTGEEAGRALQINKLANTILEPMRAMLVWQGLVRSNWKKKLEITDEETEVEVKKITDILVDAGKKAAEEIENEGTGAGAKPTIKEAIKSTPKKLPTTQVTQSLGDFIMEQIDKRGDGIRAFYTQKGTKEIANRFWQILAPAKGPDSHIWTFDRIINSELGRILKEQMAKMGEESKKKPDLSTAEKVAMFLSDDALRTDKVAEIDRLVREDIAKREDPEEVEYLTELWDSAIGALSESPSSETMARRIVQETLKDLGVKWSEEIKANGIGALREAVIKAIGRKIGDVTPGGTKLDLTAFNEHVGKVFDEIANIRKAAYEKSEAMRKARAAAKPTGSSLRRMGEKYDINWTELFTDLPENQKARQNELYDRILSDPRIAALPESTRNKLVESLNEAWEEIRMSIFRKEFDKMVGLPKIGEESKVKRMEREAMPEIVKLANLNLLDNDTFLQALAEKYKLPKLDHATGQKLKELGQKAAAMPEGPQRNEINQQIKDILFASKGIDLWGLLKDYWYRNVMSGPRTGFDIGLGGLIQGAARTLTTMTDVGIFKKNPALAMKFLGMYLKDSAVGAIIAADVIRTGDRTGLPRYHERFMEAMESFEKGKSPGGTIESEYRRSSGWKKAGLYPFELAGRILTGLDYIGAQGVRQQQMAYAALNRNDRASFDAAMQRFNAEASALAEKDARATLGPDARYAQILAQTRENLLKGISKDIHKYGDLMSEVIALNAEPAGLLGMAFGAITSGRMGKAFSVVKYPLQMAFIRAAFNLLQEATNWMPGTGQINALRTRWKNPSPTNPFAFLSLGQPYEGKGIDKTNVLAPERANHVVMAQGIGLALTLAAIGKFILGAKDDDDEGVEREMELSGPWLGLTPAQRSARMAAGEKPYSIRLTKNGNWISYKLTPFYGVLGMVGHYRDQQRYNGKKWDEESLLSQVINSWAMGVASVKDLSVASQFSLMTGMLATDDRRASADMSEMLKRSTTDAVSSTATGLIPMSSLMREVDFWFDEQRYRPNKDNPGLDALLKNVPFVRRTVGDGADGTSFPALDFFGKPVKVHVRPWNRHVGPDSPLDPAEKAFSDKTAKGMKLPSMSGNTLIATIENGKSVQREMTEEEGYFYQRSVRQFLGKQIKSDLEAFKAATTDQAAHYVQELFTYAEDYTVNRMGMRKPFDGKVPINPSLTSALSPDYDEARKIKENRNPEVAVKRADLEISKDEMGEMPDTRSKVEYAKSFVDADVKKTKNMLGSIRPQGELNEAEKAVKALDGYGLSEYLKYKKANTTPEQYEAYMRDMTIKGVIGTADMEEMLLEKR